MIFIYNLFLYFGADIRTHQNADTRIHQLMQFFLRLFPGEIGRAEIQECSINTVERFERQRAVRMVAVQFRKRAAVDMQAGRQLPE